MTLDWPSFFIGGVVLLLIEAVTIGIAVAAAVHRAFPRERKKP